MVHSYFLLFFLIWSVAGFHSSFKCYPSSTIFLSNRKLCKIYIKSENLADEDIEYDSEPTIDSLFSKYSDMSPEEQEHILRQVDENKPSDIDIRMRLMGFTPLTISGYILAFLIIILNSLFGSGWLADLLGLNMDLNPASNTRIQPSPNLPFPSLSSDSFSSTNSETGIQRQYIPTIQLNRPENLLR
mmetsp:Transcript_22348/g.22535  ORF Transcript_22348/g.22535 Transcript_22348/m.22535 type:complete len:187 (-) Transcript_22348:217-777(-)